MHPPAAPQPPSIAQRMSHALGWWAVLWGVVLCCAAWLAVRHELNELLDESLSLVAIHMLAPLLSPAAPPQAASAAAVPAAAAAGVRPEGVAAASAPGAAGQHLMWQLVQHGSTSQVLRASANAPAQAVFSAPTAGFTDTPLWRVYGVALATGGPWLYVAHEQDERLETKLDLAVALAVATAPMAVLALLWLRLRMQQELQPLQRLAQRLRALDSAPPAARPGGAGPHTLRLGPPERSELGPVHHSLVMLTERLEARMARERAFTAHAAHALRTPLAGIDAQLAVALREASPAQQPRLQRTRAAAGRLQRVVAALLALFRSSHEPQRQALDLKALLAKTPLDGLRLQVDQTHALQADADLVHAALLNLLDNAQRHGAAQAWVDTPAPQVLRVRDDGPGVSQQQRAHLQAALDASGGAAPDPGTAQVADAGPHPGLNAAEPDAGATKSLGLGLLLADLVARSHGGRLWLPPSATGFVAELHLQAGSAGSSTPIKAPPIDA